MFSEGTYGGIPFIGIQFKEDFVPLIFLISYCIISITRLPTPLTQVMCPMGRHFIFGEIMVNTSETKNEKLKKENLPWIELQALQSTT